MTGVHQCKISSPILAGAPLSGGLPLLWGASGWSCGRPPEGGGFGDYESDIHSTLGTTASCICKQSEVMQEQQVGRTLNCNILELTTAIHSNNSMYSCLVKLDTSYTTD